MLSGTIGKKGENMKTLVLVMALVIGLLGLVGLANANVTLHQDVTCYYPSGSNVAPSVYTDVTVKVIGTEVLVFSAGRLTASHVNMSCVYGPTGQGSSPAKSDRD